VLARYLNDIDFQRGPFQLLVRKIHEDIRRTIFLSSP
jgi:hypothetical protein